MAKTKRTVFLPVPGSQTDPTTAKDLREASRSKEARVRFWLAQLERAMSIGRSCKLPGDVADAVLARV